MAVSSLQHFHYILDAGGSHISVLQVNSWKYEMYCDPVYCTSKLTAPKLPHSHYGKFDHLGFD